MITQEPTKQFEKSNKKNGEVAVRKNVSIVWPDNYGRILSNVSLRVPFLLYASLALTFAFWRSAWLTLKNGGVKWRDTIYPLDLLKKHLY